MADAPRLFISLYTDEDITSELAPALRERGFEAQSVAEAGLLHADDAEQLAYAAERGMAILTCNAEHFIALAQQYAESGRLHSGIIISAEQFSRRRFGELLRLVLRLLNALLADEMQNCVVYLQQFKE
ncbi:MAG: hypothetical protein FJ030_01965 [Chloroflexi bacterium]|nr:hypothetical protein [Chloroflexota bacterium]